MQLKPMANLYFKKVGKTRPDDVMESSNYEKIFQTCDGGYRWGIMTTNGSESQQCLSDEPEIARVCNCGGYILQVQ